MKPASISVKKILNKIVDSVAGTPHLWLTLLIFSIFSIIDFHTTEKYRIYIGFSESLFYLFLFCFAALKATIINFLYNLLKNKKILRIIMITVIVIYCLISLVNGVAALLYGFGISVRLFTIFYETGPAEIRGFLPGLWNNITNILLSVKTALIILGLGLIYWLVGKVKPRVWGITLLLLSVVGVSIWSYVFLTTQIARTSYFIFPKTAINLIRVKESIDIVKDLQEKIRPLPYPESLSSDTLANNIVIVIGESANRGHHSLYGYPLPTTPHLDSLSSKLFVFDNAVASSTSTAMNIIRILTFMNDMDADEEDCFKYPSMLQIFHRAGYNISWLSNQESSGRYSNLSGILANEADVVDYVGSLSSEDHLAEEYDEALLPPYYEALDNEAENKLVFLHLMGSHTNYTNRFPMGRNHIKASDELQHFKSQRPWLNEKKAQIAADYDNSILYTDSILSCIIKRLDENTRPSIMVYLADHGENVYDLDDFIGRDPRFVDVPFIVYVNEAYRKINPDVIEQLQKVLNRPFSTSETIQLLMTLTGTRYQLYAPERDILSPNFRPRTRYVDSEPYKGD